MFRCVVIMALLLSFGEASNRVQAQVGGGMGICFDEKQYTCEEMGLAFQGPCLLADCNPNSLGEWTCEKDRGLTVNNGPQAAVWWDIRQASNGGLGSTTWVNLVSPLNGCGFIIWCECDPENTWKCVDGANSIEFTPEQFRIGPIDCVGI